MKLTFRWSELTRTAAIEPSEAPAEAQGGLHCFQALTRGIEESVEVAVTTFQVYKEITGHIVFGTQSGVCRKVVAVADRIGSAIDLSFNRRTQMGPGVAHPRERVDDEWGVRRDVEHRIQISASESKFAVAADDT